MAERIVSPGVFTNERDVSFLPQGIGNIGAALIGSTVKGPAFVPTKLSSFNEFIETFGGLTEYSYLPYAAKNYFEDGGTATIVRVLGSDGYKVESPVGLRISSSLGEKVVGVLHPTSKVTTLTSVFDKSVLVGNDSASLFSLTLSGSQTNTAYTSASLNPSDDAYYTKLFGFSPRGSEDAYTYLNCKVFQSASFAAEADASIELVTDQDLDFSQEYQTARTPWITSQAVGATVFDLFQVFTLSHGNPTNYEFKIAISDIKPAGTVPGSEYGSFTLIVRRVDQDRIQASPFLGVTDSDIRPNVVEQFQNVNLDPDSPNYIARLIGDTFTTVDASGKVNKNGDYSNISKYIRVDVADRVKDKSIDVSILPFGFRALQNPLGTSLIIPDASFVGSQIINSSYNSRKFWGFDFDFSTTDNLSYLNPVPETTTTGSNINFQLGNYNQSADASFPTLAGAYSGSINLNDNQTSINTRKFMIPFQYGFDGYQPNRVISLGSDIVAGNSQGWDMSSTSAAGTVAFRKAINAVSNADEFDMNMLAIPGAIHRLHSSVTTYAKDMCEDREDVFFVMDAGIKGDSIATVANAVQSFDSNYTSVYHPWVKILDTDRNKPTWVPPSVVLPGVMAFNDSVAAEWFAPAGLNRGGLPNVIDVESRLTRAERDTLYDNRINPIASFPGQGVTVFGQKTLQGKPSALDRVNVRRLLIAVKKYIASSTRYLVFEQNTSQTRNRFLSIVNPYLDSIQQRQGLFAFRVVMDETNNTPDVIDRNILVGEIYLQPTRTAEFIVLDFNIQPTGASFPDA
jgi:hypothetical protein